MNEDNDDEFRDEFESVEEEQKRRPEDGDCILSMLTPTEASLFSAVWLTVDDEEFLLTGDMDGQVQFWKWSDEQYLLVSNRTLQSHKLGVVSLNVTPNGQYLLSSSMDSRIRLYEVSPSMNCLFSIEKSPLSIWGPSISPDGKYVAVGSCGGKVTLYYQEEATLKSKEFQSSAKYIYSTAFSPDGRMLAVGTQEGLVYVFDSDTLALVHSLTGHTNMVRSMLFSRDSTLLITGAEDRFLIAHDLKCSKQTSFCVPKPNAWVTSVATSIDENYIISSSTDSKVRVWDFRNLKLFQELGGRTCAVWAVTLNKSGTRLASVDDDGRIVLHDFVKLLQRPPRTYESTDNSPPPRQNAFEP